MNEKTVDPTSPVPLFHQIAEAIREQIKSGDLANGDALAPLREAASDWGVNLHTVRHAYTALARDGLVKSQGAKGTWVTGEATMREPANSERITLFVDGIVRQARQEFGLDPQALTQAIRVRPATDQNQIPPVYVIECSAWQCRSHADEIKARFAVNAHEWSLDRRHEPPTGIIVATYFHYNDIRFRWPHRLHDVHFVTIIPDPGLVDRIPHGNRDLRLFERDRTTAETLAADLSTLLVPAGYAIEPVVSSDMEKALRDLGEGTIALVAPRAWSSLSSETRSLPGVMEANYVIKEEDLAALAKSLGWIPVASVSRNRI
jgi:GntR family transcriptional regulator